MLKFISEYFWIQSETSLNTEKSKKSLTWFRPSKDKAIQMMTEQNLKCPLKKIFRYVQH